MNPTPTKPRRWRPNTVFLLLVGLLFGLSAMGQPAFLKDGLVAYYPFNGNANDESGQLNHFGTQLDFRADRFGTSKGAPRFSSPRPINSKPITIPGSGFTISYWLYLESTPNQEGERFLLHGSHNLGWTSSGAASFGFAVWGDGRFGVSTLHDNLVGGSVGMPSGTISVGKWYHVGMSSGGGSTKLFINGNLSGIDPGTITTRTFPLTLGGEDSYFFQSGSIDDVRIYNRALSDTEVKALYDYESTPPDNGFITNGLVAYYPFNSSAENTIKLGLSEKIGLVDFANDRFGNPKSAGRFLGLDDSYISIQLESGDYYSMTVSFWMLWDGGITGGPQQVFNKPRNINGSGLSFLRQPTGNMWGLTLIPSDDWPRIGAEVASDTDFANKWTHIAVVSHQGKLTFLLNGVSIYTSKVDRGTFNSSQAFQIGRLSEIPACCSETSLWGYKGNLDEFRIYNRALSDAEVKALYNYERQPEPNNPSIANATAQVVNGFVVGATVSSGGSGYTNNPIVSITGGGGTGAKATATQFNGVVTSITITNPGSGYTSAPTITIAPPPFPPKKATATSQVVNGFVVGTKITDVGFGYDVPPSVLLVGGGGTGATAAATVQNGVVTAITITNPGIGYTTAPLVRIASPPFTPKLAIEVSKVNVRLSVVLGRKYQIESSSDLANWKPASAVFIAQDEDLVQEFDVNTTGSYYRINQVP
jgi:hypothetical protein